MAESRNICESLDPFVNQGDEALDTDEDLDFLEALDPKPNPFFLVGESDSEESIHEMTNIPEGKKVGYSFVGKSGLRVSNICLGTMTFLKSQIPREGQRHESLAHQMLDRFVDWGGNFIDTAGSYGYGTAEKIVGSWLQRQPRDKFVVATKCFFDMERGHADCGGLSRRHLTASIEASLERLQTHYVDLYQTHTWDKETPLEETLRTLDDLVRCGKIRYAGASNLLGWQLQKIVATQEKLGLNPIVSLQQQYNLVSRASEMEVFQVCKNEGIGVLPWGPIKGGLLTGCAMVYRVDPTGVLYTAEEEECRETSFAVPASEHGYEVIQGHNMWIREKLNTGRSVAQVALKWVQQKSVVSSTIIEAASIEQLDEKMDISDWTLTPDEMKKLDFATSPEELEYPYKFEDISQWYPYWGNGRINP